MEGFGFIIVLVVLAASAIDQSESLQCYECTSAVSMEACAKNQTVKTCQNSLANPTCLTMITTVAIRTTYTKSCTGSSQCKTSIKCPAANSCTLSCCNTKLCNCNKKPCNSARSTMPVFQGMLTTFAAVCIMLFLAY